MEREWLPEEGEVALEAEQEGALAESPGVTRRREEMQAFAARMEAPPTQERPSMLSRLASWRAPAADHRDRYCQGDNYLGPAAHDRRDSWTMLLPAQLRREG